VDFCRPCFWAENGGGFGFVWVLLGLIGFVLGLFLQHPRRLKLA